MNHPAPQPKDVLFEPDGVQREMNPPWSRTEPLHLGLVRRGVLYAGLENEVLLTFLKEITNPKVPDLSWPVDAFGGVGPSLFFGRDGDGRWIPYDLDANDENREVLVRDRDWPWCWGDVVWACGIWERQLTYLRWDLDGFGELFVGRPTSDPLDPENLSRFTRSIAVRESTRSAVQKLPPSFWRRLAPERSTRA